MCTCAAHAPPEQPQACLPQPRQCRTHDLKAAVNAIIDDLAARRVDLAVVTLEEMKGHLIAALRRSE